MSDDQKYKIQFIVEGQNKPVEVDSPRGEKLTQAAYRAGVVIQQSCGGSPSCTDCKVKILDGDDSSFADPELAEKALLGNVFHITHERLSCQAIIQGDARVAVPNSKKLLEEKRKRQSERERRFAQRRRKK